MLTTLADVKAALNISGTTDDTFLTASIERASAAVESYCNRTFGTRTETQTFRLDRSRQRLILKAVPVTSITSVTEAGTTLTTADYELDASAGFLDRLDGSDKLSTWAASKIVVTYVAGYVLPGASGTVTLPADVQACTIDLVARAYHARGRDPQLRSEKILDVIDQSWTATDSVSTKGGLPIDIAERLDAYRLVTFA
jgi:uncharacterized phiE125 gp8 family phage protein